MNIFIRKIFRKHLSSCDFVSPTPTHQSSCACMCVWMVHMGLIYPPSFSVFIRRVNRSPGADVCFCMCVHCSPHSLSMRWKKRLFVQHGPPSFLSLEKRWGGHVVWQGELGNTAGTPFSKNIFRKQQLIHIESHLNEDYTNINEKKKSYWMCCVTVNI